MIKNHIIEIGFGPHAKRIYGPALLELGNKYNTRLSLVVDLKEKADDVIDFFRNYNKKPDFLFINPFSSDILPPKVNRYLSEYVKRKRINGVIISTEPLSHYAYARWALDLGLNILMDKPITTERNAVSDIKSAKKIEENYLDLLIRYKKLQKSKNTIFTINTQRRFHPGFKVVQELLTEIALKTNCPITSIQSSHCDGQWRLPNEIVSQDYHPYNSGYGKVSHSGYHIIDTAYQFYKISNLTNKVADEMEIYSSFLQPRGFLHQINEMDYERYFGLDYKTVKTKTESELYSTFKDYGEIDMASIVRLKKDGDCVGNISINLMHNGFAMRTWLMPGKDLYKGNGRVKHEYHNIQQGPFQNIQIHSYQSKDRHEISTYRDYELGGNNHFDIYIFRNKNLTKNGKSLRVMHMSDFKEYTSETISQNLVTEKVKQRVVAEFLGFMQNLIKKKDIKSHLDDHLIPVQIMSGIYQSHNNYMQGKNPLVDYKLDL